jgi:hypothetical protein
MLGAEADHEVRGVFGEPREQRLGIFAAEV